MSTNRELDNMEYNIKTAAAALGLAVSGRDGIISVSGKFTPGDTEAYRKMESDANTILRMFRQVRPGSIWGNDSGSIGGAIGLKNGSFILHKSGCEKRLVARFGR